MALSVESPRFSIREDEFAKAHQALDEVGHVVLDGLWRCSFLTMLREIAKRGFHSSSHDATYLPNIPAGARRELFVEFERSGAPALFRDLLRGDFFVANNEMVLRRADTSVVSRFSGLHKDGQLKPCSEHGVNSRREFTIWTPLQDCGNDLTPRLLLLRRGEHFKDVFSKENLIQDHDTSFLPIQLQPHAGRINSVSADTVDQMFDQLYSAKQCYAPYIPFGSAILFERDIVHGSYRHSQMTIPRLSLDFRITGRFMVTTQNVSYQGIIFQSGAFPQLPQRKRYAGIKAAVRSFIPSFRAGE